jgi:ABC-type glycerol-3-phosphate transport system substrate-binding protein
MKPFAPLLSVVRVFCFTLLASLLTQPLFGAGVTVRFASEPSSEGGRFNRALAEEWAQKTGNKVEYIFRPSDGSTALQVCQQYWAAKSPDVDVYQIDVIWQGMADPHAVDLKKYYKEDEIKAYFPRIIENNTVSGKLVSIPLYTDAGIFFYRTDRPSTVTGADYNQLSTALFQNVNEVLTGAESGKEAVAQVERAKRIVH